jgi:hypothetical protein
VLGDEELEDRAASLPGPISYPPSMPIYNCLCDVQSEAHPRDRVVFHLRDLVETLEDQLRVLFGYTGTLIANREEQTTGRRLYANIYG